jgi:uncharacterized protein YqjF (DUF2071 family)
VRGLPALCHGGFDEVNLRFYVRRLVGDEVRRGVVFIREVVARRAVAAIANRIYHEKYVRAPMVSRVAVPGQLEYRWKHGGRWHLLGAEIAGNSQPMPAGSLTEFIAEHYWGYTKRRDGSTAEYRVDHPAWNAWPAERAWHDIDAADFYGPAFAPMLREPPVSSFVADGSAVTVYRGQVLPP